MRVCLRLPSVELCAGWRLARGGGGGAGVGGGGWRD